ncbi:unnamed protein product, partial [Rotaria magnacalcarata]
MNKGLKRKAAAAVDKKPKGKAGA